VQLPSPRQRANSHYFFTLALARKAELIHHLVSQAVGNHPVSVILTRSGRIVAARLASVLNPPRRRVTKEQAP
jgi:hypothetical protein